MPELDCNRLHFREATRSLPAATRNGLSQIVVLFHGWVPKWTAPAAHRRRLRTFGRLTVFVGCSLPSTILHFSPGVIISPGFLEIAANGFSLAVERATSTGSSTK